MASPELNEAIQLLSKIYLASHNNERRMATEQLSAFENSLNGPSMLSVGVGILQMVANNVTVQAYGAVILEKGIVSGLISTQDLPLRDLVVWMWEDPQVTGLLEKNLSTLIVESAVRGSSENLLEMFSWMPLEPSSTPLPVLRKKMRLLCDIVLAILEPSVQTSRIKGLTQLQQTLKNNFVPFLHYALSTVQLLHGDPTLKSTQELPWNTMELLDSSTMILGTFSPLLSAQMWENLRLISVFCTLLQWKPAQKFIFNVLLSVIKGLFAAPEKKDFGKQLFGALLDSVTSILNDVSSYDAVEVVLDYLQAAKADELSSDLERLVQFALQLLKVPSLYFASRIFNILLPLKEKVMTIVNAFEFCEAVFFFAQKHQCHPVHGFHPHAVELSRMHFDTDSDRDYKMAFGSLRNYTGSFLGELAQKQPLNANKYIFYRLQQLKDIEGTPQDPRTEYGSVTQQSRTFVSWEATAFMVTRLSASFELCQDYTSESFSLIIQKNTPDAVLRPSYLDILTSFWKCKKVDISIWEGTLNILLSDLENTKASSNDEDVLSARRRVCVLLVNSASYGNQFVPLIEGLLNRINSLLLKSRGTERCKLYEASVLFSIQLDPTSGANCIRPIMEPVIEQALSLVSGCGDQDAFNRVLMGASDSETMCRHQIQESMGILCACFSARTSSPYLIEVAIRLQPTVKKMFQFIHGIVAEKLPEPFNLVSFLSEQDYAIYVNPKSKKSHIDRTVLGLARGFLATTRFSVYQLKGFLCCVLPLANVMDMCEGLTERIPFFPMNCMKTYINQALLPIMQKHKEAIPSILIFLNQYCAYVSSCTPQKIPLLTVEEEEIVHHKMWSSLGFMIAAAIVEERVMNTNLWVELPNLAQVTCDLISTIGMSVATDCCANLLKRFFEAKPPNVDSNLLHGVHCYAFQSLCRLIIQAPDNVFKEKARSFFACSVSEFFTSFFPEAKASLIYLGACPDDLEKLHGCLLVTSTPKAQMHACRKYLLLAHNLAMRR